MNILIKSSLGIGTIVGVSGMSYGIYSMQSKPEKSKEKTETPSYAVLLNDTLLSTENDQNSTEWGRRLASLKEARENDLIDSLKKIKEKKQPQKEATWQDLRDWCKDNINNSSKGESDKEFKNIQSYCTFSIKEKITDAVDEVGNDGDDSKWAVGHKKLQNINDNELVSDLVAAKKQQNGTGNSAIKAWCTKAYKQPYKGVDDKDYNNASRICVSK